MKQIFAHNISESSSHFLIFANVISTFNFFVIVFISLHRPPSLQQLSFPVVLLLVRALAQATSLGIIDGLADVDAADDVGSESLLAARPVAHMGHARGEGEAVGLLARRWRAVARRRRLLVERGIGNARKRCAFGVQLDGDVL